MRDQTSRLIIPRSTEFTPSINLAQSNNDAGVEAGAGEAGVDGAEVVEAGGVGEVEAGDVGEVEVHEVSHWVEVPWVHQAYQVYRYISHCTRSWATGNRTCGVWCWR